jgi:hypothetical protein
MKLLVTAILALWAVTVQAQTAGAASGPKKELTPQQMLMSTCQEDATASGKKGKERQEVVNKCVADGRKQQNEKMSLCQKNEEVTSRAGQLPERGRPAFCYNTGLGGS